MSLMILFASSFTFTVSSSPSVSISLSLFFVSASVVVLSFESREEMSDWISVISAVR